MRRLHVPDERRRAVEPGLPSPSRALAGARGRATADRCEPGVEAEPGAGLHAAPPNFDNVATVEGGQGILKSALDAFDHVDILVNNAGILRDKSFVKTTEDLWDPVLAVHLKGTYCVTHAIYSHMKERGQGGVIINTSSTSGLNGNFGQCNYGAAKAGIAGFTRCLAIEGQEVGNSRPHPRTCRPQPAHRGPSGLRRGGRQREVFPQARLSPDRVPRE